MRMGRDTTWQSWQLWRGAGQDAWNSPLCVSGDDALKLSHFQNHVSAETLHPIVFCSLHQARVILKIVSRNISVFFYRVSSSQLQIGPRNIQTFGDNRRNDKVKRWPPNSFIVSPSISSIFSDFEGSRLTNEKRVLPALTNERPSPPSLPESPQLRLFVKDWVAQWDPLYNAWFYYHPETGGHIIHNA